MASTRQHRQLNKILTNIFQQEFPDSEIPCGLDCSIPKATNESYDVEENLDLSLVPANTKVVIFPAMNNQCSYEDLLRLPTCVESLYLAHDGVIYGTGEQQTITNKDVLKVFQHFPNLNKIEVCGYYSKFEDTLDIVEFAKTHGVSVTKIY